jgi:hypothetical protein
VRIDDGASRAHTGTRLERPFLFRPDNPRDSGEGWVYLACEDRRLALDDRRGAMWS